MVPSGSPSRTPLISTIVIIIILSGAFAYYFVTASSTISNQSSSIGSLKGQVSSLQGQVSTLNLNVTHQTSARQALQAMLKQANATIVSLSGEVSSQSSQVSSLSGQLGSACSQITSLSSVAYLKVEQTLVNNQNYNLQFNSSTTVTSFTVSAGAFLQISGSSNTNVILAICYGATSQSQCDSSTTYYFVRFGFGGATFNAPLMPGPVWINAYNFMAGSATLSVVEWS